MKCPTCQARIDMKTWKHQHGSCLGHVFWLIRQLSANKHSPKLTASIWALEGCLKDLE